MSQVEIFGKVRVIDSQDALPEVNIVDGAGSA